MPLGMVLGSPGLASSPPHERPVPLPLAVQHGRVWPSCWQASSSPGSPLPVWPIGGAEGVVVVALHVPQGHRGAGLAASAMEGHHARGRKVGCLVAGRQQPIGGGQGVATGKGCICMGLPCDEGSWVAGQTSPISPPSLPSSTHLTLAGRQAVGGPQAVRQPLLVLLWGLVGHRP